MKTRTEDSPHVSYWVDSAEMPDTTTLSANQETDVLVVGGGIAGLTTAYFLCKAGMQVTVVEDGTLGSGETGHTTAHLTAALDDRYYELEEIFGKKAAALAAESHTTAISAIEHIVGTEHIDCHFRRLSGYLFPDPSDDPENIRKELDATRNAGLKTVLHQGVPAMAGGENTVCLEFPHQAQFHIMKYLSGLASAVLRIGGRIYTQSRALEISKKGAKVNGFDVTAKHIVVATNTPVNDLVTMHLKQFAYRTYVVAAKIKKGALPDALWWDTGNVGSKWPSQPYHYVRLEPFDDHCDLLICGGEDHKVGQAEAEEIPETERYDRLESWSRQYFPEMEEIVYRWSGQVMEPVDALGFMGKNPGDENIYIITGDSGNGMTHTTIGAMIIRDLITGTPNRWAALYDPARITGSTAKTFFEEALNSNAQYADWVTPGEIDSTDELKPGEGAIMRQGLRKLAVFRDTNGMVHTFSAVCPHLKGILRWNGDEKSFDCPVHGSRFSCLGELLNGPAVTSLSPLED